MRLPAAARRSLPRLAAATAVAASVVGLLAVTAIQPWSRPPAAKAEEILEGIRAEAFSGAAPTGVVMTTAACHPFELPGASLTPGTDVFHITTNGAQGPSGAQGAVILGPDGAAPGSGTPGPAFGISIGDGQDGPNPGSGPVFFGLQQGAPGTPGPIAGPGGPGQGPIVVFGSGPEPGASASAPVGPGAPPIVGPATTELSDSLGQALGVSGEQVREAMRQTVGTLPRPADPLSRIATQLGVTTDQVREAFSDPACPGQVLIRLHGADGDLTTPAQKLGVSTDRLAAAIDAAAPPPPPRFDDLVNRFAQNLGVSPDRLRAALEQVEGPNRLYMAVPAPAAPIPPGSAATPVPVR